MLSTYHTAFTEPIWCSNSKFQPADSTEAWSRSAWLPYRPCSDWTLFTPPRDAPSEVQRNESGCDRLALRERFKLCNLPDWTRDCLEVIAASAYNSDVMSSQFTRMHYKAYRSARACSICNLEAPIFVPFVQIAISCVCYHQIAWNLVPYTYFHT